MGPPTGDRQLPDDRYSLAEADAIRATAREIEAVTGVHAAARRQTLRTRAAVGRFRLVTD